MNTFEAINKAADFIESNPSRYNFMTVYVPRNPDDTGCMLGWIGHFIGDSSLINTCNVSQRLGTDDYTFYKTVEKYKSGENYASMFTPQQAADALRWYAAKFHSGSRYSGIPKSVGDLFTARPREAA